MAAASAQPHASSPPSIGSAALGVYVGAVVLIGAAAVLHSAVALVSTPHPLAWLLFAVLAIATGSFTVNPASVQATISVSDTFFIASALLFGPVTATVALAVDSLVLSWRMRHAWHRVAFNAVAPALSMWVAGQVFFLFARVQPLADGHAAIGSLIPPLAGLAVIYFGLNSGLMAIAVGLEAGQSPIAIWRKYFLWLSSGYLAAASIAFCLILVVQQISLGAAAVILPVLAVFHLTLRSSFGRLEDTRRHLSEIDRLYRSTVETLAMAIDAKDDVTHSHVRRVQAYAMALARAIGVDDEPTLRAIEAAALLHDTGKLAVPEQILNKPGRLTVAEFERMKMHVDIGADILSLVEFPYPVVPIVRCHHESWDGSGYPRGVAGEAIPIGARILSVVDCFDALTSDRPYRRRLPDQEALAILRERRGNMYDPRVVDTFTAIYRDVELADVDAPEHRHVLELMHRANQPEPVASSAARLGDPPVSADVLAFVSIARMAEGDVTRGDVLALASNLVRNLVPGATGAWFILDAVHDRLVAAEVFGPAGPVVSGLAIDVGERLSGWVAAHRHAVLNSDAALDLGAAADAVQPPLERCVSVPLTVGETLVGVFTLYAPRAEALTDDHGRLIQMIAPHVAQAIAAATPASAAAAVRPQPAGGRDLRLVAAR